MLVIGLTGGIATGKSAAGAYLAQLGARVWDADRASRELSHPGGEFNRRIREHFGGEYFDAQGNLLRAQLAEHVFADPARRNRLNALAHPLLLDNLRAALARFQSEGASVAVVEAALLFETGADQYCDEVWTLSCGVDEQLRRLMHRDGLPPAQAQARVDAQMTDAQRRALSTRVIDTSGEPADTRRHLRALYEELLEDHAPPR